MTRLVWTFCLLLLPAVVSAQNGLPPLIDREVFFGDPQISGAQISPDGAYIAFIKPFNGARNIHVVRRGQPFSEARPITADRRPVPGYFWSRDGRYILFVQDTDGDENFNVHAVDVNAPVNPETGVPAPRNLTDAAGARAMIVSVPRFDADLLYVGLNDRDPAWHDLYSVRISTGERTLLHTNTQRLSGYVLDEQGTFRLSARTTDNGSTEILRVMPNGELEEVYTCTVFESCGPVRFHPDNVRVYMTSDRGEANLSRLTLFNPETREEVVVEEDPMGEVDFGGARFLEDTGEIVATFYYGDTLRVYPRTDQIRQDYARVRAVVGRGAIGFGSRTTDERLQLVSVSSDVDPGSVYLYDRETGSVELLYRGRPEVPSEHMAEMTPIRYTARDGLVIPAYLTLPKGVEPRNLPVVVVPHGGPWARDTWGFDPFVQFLANRGYAVLQPNFRGSTGFGKAFLNAGNGEWGTGTMQHDITDGVQYLIDQGIADPARVGIFGGSYGGYATLAGLAFTPDLYAAGVSFVGPSNILTLLSTIPPYWEAVRTVFNTRIGNPDDPADQARLIAQSPLFSADQIRSPLMVVQGANDPRVKQSESDQIVVALRDRGFPVEYIVAPDEGHGFRAPNNNMAFAAAMERFFAQHLGGRHQADMPEAIATRLAEITVDVNTVEMPDFGAAEAAASADLPPVNGAALRGMTLQYASRIAIMGQQLETRASRTISQAPGMWRIVDNTSLPAMMGGGMAIDTMEVHGANLRPMRRSSSVQTPMGAQFVRLAYTDNSVTGVMGAGPQTMNINATLDAPIFGDGAALELALAAMPLSEGFEAMFRSFNPQAQATRPFRLQVTGTSSVTVPAGTFDVLVVSIQPLDGDNAGTSTFHVMAAAPHVVVKSEVNLGAQMMGATSTTELTSMQ